MIRKAVLVVLLPLIIPPAAAAEIPTGTELYLDCTGAAGGEAGFTLMNTCQNYLLGVIDGAKQAGARTGNSIICTTGAIMAGQLRLIYIRWAESNPRYLNYQQADAAMMSLMGAFPCASQSR